MQRADLAIAAVNAATLPSSRGAQDRAIACRFSVYLIALRMA